MKKLLLVSMLLVTFIVPSYAGVQSSVGNYVSGFQVKEALTFGVGVKWDHDGIGSKLEMQDHMWVGSSLKLPFNDKVGLLGTFERDAVKEPIYSVRAGVWFRPF